MIQITYVSRQGKNVIGFGTHNEVGSEADHKFLAILFDAMSNGRLVDPLTVPPMSIGKTSCLAQLSELPKQRVHERMRMGSENSCVSVHWLRSLVW